MRCMPFHYERHGCSQLLGFVRPKWQRRSGAASGSFGDDARNLLRLRFVSPKLSRGHSYLSLGFVRPRRHLVLAERGALAERVVLAGRPSGSFGRDRMRWVAPPRVCSAKFCCGSRNALGSFGQNIPNRSASCARKGGRSAETLYPLRRKGSHKGLTDEASRPDSDGCQ
jgi:hypothetical protein